MSSNDMNTWLLATMFYLRLVGILEWSIVFFLLMEVLICKDLREGNFSRALNGSTALKWRMFRKNLKSRFFKGTLVIWGCSFFTIILTINDIWMGTLPCFPYIGTLLSIVLPIGLILLYTYWGFQITFFKKFKLFLQDMHE